MTDSAKGLAGLDAKKRELLALLAREKGLDPYALPIPPRPADLGHVPLSLAQERLWVLGQIEPDSPAYNEPYWARLAGALDVAALRSALAEAVRRHEILRTTFPNVEGVAAQVVQPPSPPPLPLADLGGLAAARREGEALRIAAVEARRPFDLATGPLLRVRLVRLAVMEHALLVNLHHIVCDATSIGILAAELAAAYDALAERRAPELPPLPIQYADFAIWQRQWMERSALAGQLAYWRERLAGAPALLELATDRPRQLERSGVGGRIDFALPAELSRALRALAQQRGATLFMLVLAAFKVLLSRWSGQRDVLVGTPISGRTRSEVERLVGFFVNTLALRTDLAGDPTFLDLLDRVQKTSVDAFDHQDLPFARIVEMQQPERDGGYPPVVQVVFMLQRSAAPVRSRRGLALRLQRIETYTSKFDLTLQMTDREEGVSGAVEHDAWLFDGATARRLASQLEVLLAGVAARPEVRLSELPVLSEVERHQVTVEWSGRSGEPLAERCLHESFFEQARQRPEAVALVFEGERVAYGELAARAGRLAARLAGLGVGPDVAVGLCLERSVELVVGMYGILAAGGAYLPLDPEYPAERLSLMAEDAGAPVVVTQSRLRERVPAGPWRVVEIDAEDSTGEASVAVPAVTPSHLAYLIYTSGSTGRPKGTLVAHRGVVNMLRWRQHAYALSASDAVLQTDSFSFDASVWQFFWPLAVGARLVLTAPGGHRDAASLVRLMAAEGVTVAGTVPSMLQVLAEEPGLSACRSLRHLFCGGEALPAELVERVCGRLPGLELHNVYGPTEATIDATDATLRGGERWAGRRVAPIGRPLANQRAWILDGSMRPSPIGVPGELYVGGVGLARGYRGRAELTAERFVPDAVGAEAGARLYRTGDRARWLADGQLEFLGRLDHQVKVRGFRIELGEIESALLAHPGVKEAAVVAREEPGGSRRLVAYLVGREGEAPSGPELRSFLKQSLPEHMVPSAWVALPALPLTPNGKLDRSALPAPLAGRPEVTGGHEPPRSEVQRLLVELWKEALGVDKVGIHDNFFDLGGHSLLLIQLQARLRQALGREVPVVELFRHTTIDSLAGFLEPRDEPAAEPAAPPRPAAVVRPGLHGREIAIVGLSGRFPGAGSVDELWRNVRDGVESITFFSDEELLEAGIPAELLSNPAYVKANATLEGVELFDAAFFGFSPREAQLLDPQHRHFLECAWEALETAGYDPGRYAGSIGVFAGMGMNTYLINNVYANPELVQAIGTFQTALGNDKDFMPTRVSYKLNLRGPSMVVQTACSTSLVAVHVACRSLLAGECDMALAGGVTINVPQKRGYLYQDGGIFSPDGHCRTFDADAKGTIGASGVAIVALKRLADALADGDTIHAVIKGSAINNDGSQKVGYTAPGVHGQIAVIRRALEAAEVDPETVAYVETHGTGTPLGDLVEVSALKEAYRPFTEKVGFCAIGSLKSNFGHLDTAAGAGGLIKATLALRHGQIPPSLHFKRPNPRLHLGGSPFYVATELSGWPIDGVPRRAGVSSFGIGGTNAHVILEQAPAPEPTADPRPHHLVLISARTPTALERAVAGLGDHLASHPDLALADVAFTLQLGRAPFEQRRAAVAGDAAEAAETLRAGRLLAAIGEPSADRPVVFMFPGGGAQHVDMARELYALEAPFREEVDRCSELLRSHLGLDLRELLYPAPERAEEAAQRLRRTEIGLPALFTIEYALAKLWIAWGIKPQALIGHSLGEYAAACLGGILSLEDALALVALRGRLFELLPEGSMLGVPLPERELAPRLGPGLSIAAVNLPFHCVVSGRTEAVADLEAQLTAEGLDCRRIHIDVAAHSEMVEAILPEFARFADGLAPGPPAIPVLSNVTGTWITAREATDPSYWPRHLRQTVRFADGVRELFRKPERILLEVGPGRTLATFARRHPDRPSRQVVLTSLRHPAEEERDTATILAALGQLWCEGLRVDWTAFHGERRPRRVPLPTYPFERERFWAEPRSAASRAQASAGTARRLEPEEWISVPTWTRVPLGAPPAAAGPGEGTLLVLGDLDGPAARLSQALAGRWSDVVTAVPGDDCGWAGDGIYRLRPEEPGDFHALLADLAAAGRSPTRIVHAWALPPAADGESLERWLALGFQSLEALVQACESAPVPIAVVASELHEVVGGEPLAPAKAAVLGWCRELSAEGAAHAVRAIDVVPEAGERWAEQVAAELERGSEAIVAYRGGRRWVRALERVRATGAAPWQDGGVWLVLGAEERFGAGLAEAVAMAGRARIVLATTVELPPREVWDELLAAADAGAAGRLVQTVKTLEGHGATVEVAPLGAGGVPDLADRVRELCGALDGVIDAAAVEPEGGGGRGALRAAARRALSGRQALAGAGFHLVARPLTRALGPAATPAERALGHLVHAAALAERRGGAAPWIDLVWDDARGDGEAEPASAGAAMAPAEGARALGFVLALADEPRLVVSTRDLAVRARSWAAGTSSSDRGTARDGSGQALHSRPEIGVAYAPPRNDLERLLVKIWEDVLGVAPVGIHDNFHALGGDSVLAIQTVSKAQQHGIALTQRKAYLHPTIADVVAAVGIDSSISAKQGTLTGRVLLTPVQHWFFEMRLPDPHHWNLDMLVEVREDADPRLLAEAFRLLVLHHDALRLRFAEERSVWQQWYAEPDDSTFFHEIDLSGLPEPVRRRALEAAAATLQTSLDLGEGPLLRAGFFRLGHGVRNRLLIAIHHLAVDAVSWRIILEDLQSWYEQLARGEAVRRSLKTTSLDHWAVRLSEYGRSRAVEAELDYWCSEARRTVSRLKVDLPGGVNDMGSIARVSLSLSPAATRSLLQELPKAYGTEITDVLLTAMAQAYARWKGDRSLVVDIESHGREPIFEEVDLSRTVGWFTSVFPLLLDLREVEDEPRAELEAIKRQIRALPGRGLGYGLLRHLSQSAEVRERIRAMPPAEVIFLYLGQANQGADDAALLRVASEAKGPSVSPRGLKQHLLDIGVRIVEGQLHVSFAYSENLFHRSTIERLAHGYLEALSALIDGASTALAESLAVEALQEG